jgi:hypothetical protein
MREQIIIDAIDQSPLNQGLRGCDWIADERNHAFVEGQDVVLFDYENSGVYAVHVLLESRGRKAIGAIKRAFTDLFEQRPDANIILGLVPLFRHDVKLMARWCGMKIIARYGYNGQRVEAYGITRDEFMKGAVKWDS